MPEEIWNIFLQACIHQQGTDNSMSGWLTDEAQKGIDWLMENSWDE